MIDELARISGLRRDSREALHAAGIHTLEQLAALPDDALRQIRGIKSTAPSIRAAAESLVRNAPVWHGPLVPQCRLAGVMFDCETNPSNGQPWSLGWLDCDGEPHVALVGRGAHRRLPDGTHVHIAPHADDAWHIMADALAGADTPIFHWTGYDAGVLRATAPAAVRQTLEPRFFDLHRAFSRAVRFPVDGTSLKRVSAFLGFSYGAYESWFAAWEDYRHWLRSGSDDALVRSMRYQMDDVIALNLVWQWLSTAITPDETGG